VKGQLENVNSSTTLGALNLSGSSSCTWTPGPGAVSNIYGGTSPAQAFIFGSSAGTLSILGNSSGGGGTAPVRVGSPFIHPSIFPFLIIGLSNVGEWIITGFCMAAGFWLFNLWQKRGRPARPKRQRRRKKLPPQPCPEFEILLQQPVNRSDQCP
jgi:hypothetical protein